VLFLNDNIPCDPIRYKQDRQCTEARSRNHCCSGRAKSISYSDCVCSLRYPANKAHAPYRHLWPLWLCHISPNYLINGTIFGKIFLNIKCVLSFSTMFVSNISHPVRIERDMIKNVHWSSRKVRVILVRF